MDKKAFTTIELIMSIAIMTILGTIAIVSFMGYSINSRNTVRVTDLGNIASVLELFEVKTGSLPNTTNGHTIVHSGAVLWHQGTFGNTTTTLVDILSGIPIDPQTGNEYTYSRAVNKNEYELGAIYEGIQFARSSNIISQTHAEQGKIATALVRGNYNGILLKANNGLETFVFALPSIISSDLSNLNIGSIVYNKKLVSNKHLNLPASYETSDYDTDGGFDFSPGPYLIYESTTDLFELNNTGIQVQFARDLQNAYRGTILGQDGGNIQNILSVDTVSDLNGTLLFAQSLIHNYINELVKVSVNE